MRFQNLLCSSLCLLALSFLGGFNDSNGKHQQCSDNTVRYDAGKVVSLFIDHWSLVVWTVIFQIVIVSPFLASTLNVHHSRHTSNHLSLSIQTTIYQPSTTHTHFQTPHSQITVVLASSDAAVPEVPDSELPVEGAVTVPFQAEVSRILDIVVNSLYQNKDVFLRELISNASDALDKVRFIGITKPEVYEDKQELEVRISFNPDDVSLTITDSGIGMTKDELIGNLGTIAQSGTTNFLDALKDGASVDQIGMFGVGFYSAFLVAEKIVVASKSPNQDTQHVWISHNGQSSFSVAEDPRGNTLGRGTEITLYLKEDAFEWV